MSSPASKSSPKRTVLVTGGAQRLGAAICEAFAQAGWQVICQYRTAQAPARALCERLQAQGLQIQSVQADLTHEAERAVLMAQLATKYGVLHALVNNASEFVADTGLDFDNERALQQLQVNLMAPLSLTRMLAKQLGSAAGRVDACAIHVLDQKVYNLNPDYFSYTVSKLALERAVALQAQALAPALRVCGVAPGLMYLSGPQTAENFARASQVNLLRRATDPFDVAKTCVFLASTSSITGTTLCVDSGQHLVPLPRDVMFVVDDLLKSPETKA